MEKDEVKRGAKFWTPDGILWSVEFVTDAWHYLTGFGVSVQGSKGYGVAFRNGGSGAPHGLPSDAVFGTHKIADCVLAPEVGARLIVGRSILRVKGVEDGRACVEGLSGSFVNAYAFQTGRARIAKPRTIYRIADGRALEVLGASTMDNGAEPVIVAAFVDSPLDPVIFRSEAEILRSFSSTRIYGCTTDFGTKSLFSWNAPIFGADLYAPLWPRSFMFQVKAAPTAHDRANALRKAVDALDNRAEGDLVPLAAAAKAAADALVDYSAHRSESTRRVEKDTLYRLIEAYTEAGEAEEFQRAGDLERAICALTK